MLISKLDAAKRQLEMAIKLYFKNGDPVCIHTLLGASHEILMNLANREGQESIIKQKMLSIVKPEEHKHVLEILNKARNFFKHADRDAEETIEFKAEMNDGLLRDSVKMYQSIVGSYSDIMNAFDSWFMLHHKTFFPTILPHLEEMIKKFNELGLENKESFFNTFIEAHFSNHVS